MMKLILSEIQDLYLRKNLEMIQSFLSSQSLLSGNFKHFEIQIQAAVTHLKYPHNLGFTPKDVLPTSVTGTGQITWNYSLFDGKTLDLSTTGPCVVRAYIGSHQENA